MKIYIVHRDAECDFGNVLGVFTTKRKAKNFIEKDWPKARYRKKEDNYNSGACEWITIQEWEIQ